MTQATPLDILPITAPTRNVPGPAQGFWTYDEYAKIPDDGNRYEIIDGILYMSPAPGGPHQSSNIRFSHFLFMHVELAGLGKVFQAPFDVVLTPSFTVQPDITVLLNAHMSRYTGGNIEGAPDLVVEIASPSTATYDRNIKLNAYARAGVSEYWIADPIARTVEVMVLNSGQYQALGIFRGQAKLPSQVVLNLPVEADQFFG